MLEGERDNGKTIGKCGLSFYLIFGGRFFFFFFFFLMFSAACFVIVINFSHGDLSQPSLYT